ncbi:MAG: hypothetical protein JWM10_4565 [Myxococcaceae bacterium]|nr:hypothetical protein [Myxococcaceae bacterium]
MINLVVAAVFEGMCADGDRLTRLEGPLVTVTADDAVVAGALVVTRGEGLRAYARDTGALRWSAQLPGATEAERDVLVGYDPQHGELGVLWTRAYLVAPDRPGNIYTAVHFARLGLDGRWIDPRPIDVTPRDPRHGATLGYQTPAGQLRWTGRSWRFAWWQSDHGYGNEGELRLGELSREGRLSSSLLIAAERADVFDWADGATGTAVVWTTLIASRPVARARLPGYGSLPFTLDPEGTSPHVVWHRGAFFAAWDHGPSRESPGDRLGARVGRLDARRGAEGVREAPLDLSPGEWPSTRGIYATRCGLVVHALAMSARTSTPWLWFIP